MDLFLPEPFASSVCLELLLCDQGSLRVETGAMLENHLLTRAPSDMMPGLVPCDDARARGVLVRLDDEMVPARLAYVMEGFGAEAIPVSVICSGSTVNATAWVQGQSAGLAAPSEPAQWGPDDQAVLDEVVWEIAGLFGRKPASDLPGLLHGIGFRAIARVRGARTRTPTDLRGTSPAEDDIEPLAFQSGYAKYFAVEEHRYRHRRFDGSLSAPLDRAILASGDAVTVLPFDPATGNVLVIEQVRPAPLARCDPNPWLIEPIAGRCDKLEPSEATARREAKEEAGVTLGRLELISAYYSTPGISSEYMTSYVAEADLSNAGGNYGLDEEGEDIRAIVLPLDVAMQAVASGEINVGPLVLSLFWLNANRERLMRVWSAESAA